VITETATDDAASSVVEALHSLAAVVITEHRSDHDQCAVCGSDFPCELAVLAEHNLAL
jgi:hypothetical protein